jgi:hypothetical protein
MFEADISHIVLFEEMVRVKYRWSKQMIVVLQ